MDTETKTKTKKGTGFKAILDAKLTMLVRRQNALDNYAKAKAEFDALTEKYSEDDKKELMNSKEKYISEHIMEIKTKLGLIQPSNNNGDDDEKILAILSKE